MTAAAEPLAPDPLGGARAGWRGASLAGVPVPQARRSLAELAAASLVIEHAGGRFACHDLLRTYADELTRTRDPDRVRRQALRRLLDHYLRTTHAATSTLVPHRAPVTLPPALPGAHPEPVTAERSLPWLASERTVLVNAVALAARYGLDSHAWQLASVLYPFLDSRGYWHDATATLQLALAAAKRAADPTAQTHIHWYHGRSLARQGQCEAAREHVLRALDMFTGVGDHHRQAAVHLVLGALSESQGRDPREALDHAHQALRLNRVAGHLVGQARAVNAVAWSYVRLGDPEASLVACRQALAIHQRVDDPSGAANAWDTAGLAHVHLGDHCEAITCLERAVELYDRSEERLGRAETRHRPGDAYLAVKDSAAAHAAWEHAAAIFHELGDGRAEEVRGKLQTRVGR